MFWNYAASQWPLWELGCLMQKYIKFKSRSNPFKGFPPQIVMQKKYMGSSWKEGKLQTEKEFTKRLKFKGKTKWKAKIFLKIITASKNACKYGCKCLQIGLLLCSLCRKLYNIVISMFLLIIIICQL